MAQVQRQIIYRVDILEFERGYGSKIEDVIYFDNEMEARQYVLDFNAKNILQNVPDWYMCADYRGSC